MSSLKIVKDGLKTLSGVVNSSVQVIPGPPPGYTPCLVVNLEVDTQVLARAPEVLLSYARMNALDVVRHLTAGVLQEVPKVAVTLVATANTMAIRAYSVTIKTDKISLLRSIEDLAMSADSEFSMVEGVDSLLTPLAETTPETARALDAQLSAVQGQQATKFVDARRALDELVEADAYATNQSISGIEIIADWFRANMNLVAVAASGALLSLEVGSQLLAKMPEANNWLNSLLSYCIYPLCMSACILVLFALLIHFLQFVHRNILTKSALMFAMRTMRFNLKKNQLEPETGTHGKAGLQQT